MDRTEAQRVLTRLTEVLADEFPEYNARFGGTKFDKAGEISFKFDLVSIDATQDILDRDNRIGMGKNKIHPEVLGMEFHDQGKDYKVLSVKARKQKYPVVVECTTNGKRYRMPADRINDHAENIFGTKVRYVGSTAILSEVK